jgi:hypothetical protein
MMQLAALERSAVPDGFLPGTYFDFDANPFEHTELFTHDGAVTVVDAVRTLGDYVEAWLARERPRIESWEPAAILTDPDVLGFPCFGRLRVVLHDGARAIAEAVFGARGAQRPHTLHVARNACVAGTMHLENGDIYVGEGSVIERGATVVGPVILGRHTRIPPGAYVRENVIMGDHCCFRGEAKNALFMDHAVFPHPCYVGDSLCGYRSHFGNQATAANFGLFAGAAPPDRVRTIRVAADGETYDLGVKKFGMVLGDYCQVGCNAVTDPGTFLAPYTLVYPLTRLEKGFYGPNAVIKNKPRQSGAVETAPLAFLG